MFIKGIKRGYKMNTNYSPKDIAYIMLHEIDKTNISDRCIYNKEYRKIFQLMTKKMIVEYGVQYNWMNKLMSNNVRHVNFRYFSNSEFFQMVRDEFYRYKKENALVTSGMIDALDELTHIFNRKIV